MIVWHVDDLKLSHVENKEVTNLIEWFKKNFEDKDIGKISDWTSYTIDRYIDIMNGNGEQWRRDDNRYRDHVATRKY